MYITERPDGFYIFRPSVSTETVSLLWGAEIRSGGDSIYAGPFPTMGEAEAEMKKEGDL